MKLQDKIFACRKKAGLSQDALAEKIGVSRQAVSKWETGESTPEVGKLLLLAKTFGVTTDWLLSEEEQLQEDAPPKAENPPESAATVPQNNWLDSLPGMIGRLVRKYGWLLGMREAIGGALMMFMGFLIKAVTNSMGNVMNTSFGSAIGGWDSAILWTDEAGNAISAPISDAEVRAMLGSEFGYGAAANAAGGMTDPMHIMADFIIFLGAVMLVMGIVVAIWLKQKGSMPEDTLRK